MRFSDASVSELENWVNLYEDPERKRDASLKYARSEHYKRALEITKREGMDAVAYGCDYGYNTGPFMSPEMFRKAILPGLSEHCKMVHQHGLLFLLHSCGKNITLWGGVPAGDLVLSTPEQVRQTAAHYLKECKPGGGYVFATSHSIMPGAQYDNYLAMLDAHREWGGY